MGFMARRIWPNPEDSEEHALEKLRDMGDSNDLHLILYSSAAIASEKEVKALIINPGQIAIIGKIT